MRRRVTTSAGAFAAALLVVSLLLGACDPASVQRWLDGLAVDQPDAARPPPDDRAGSQDTAHPDDEARSDDERGRDGGNRSGGEPAPDDDERADEGAGPETDGATGEQGDPGAPSVLWSAGHESGDLSEWSAGGGGVFGGGEATASREQAHSGAWSARLRIGDSGAIRLFRWRESRAHDQAYYSAWFYFPQRYETVGNWWNIFQFKSSTASRNDPFWVINVGTRPDGTMHLYLHDWINRRNHSQDVVDLPVGRWVHLEAFLDQSADGDGRLTFWQDGRQLWDLRGIDTRYADGDNQWSVNNYTNGISPAPAMLYVDDAVISTQRMGP